MHVAIADCTDATSSVESTSGAAQVDGKHIYHIKMLKSMGHKLQHVLIVAHHVPSPNRE